MSGLRSDFAFQSIKKSSIFRRKYPSLFIVVFLFMQSTIFHALSQQFSHFSANFHTIFHIFQRFSWQAFTFFNDISAHFSHFLTFSLLTRQGKGGTDSTQCHHRCSENVNTFLCQWISGRACAGRYTSTTSKRVLTGCGERNKRSQLYIP